VAANGLKRLLGRGSGRDAGRDAGRDLTPGHSAD